MWKGFMFFLPQVSCLFQGILDCAFKSHLSYTLNMFNRSKQAHCTQIQFPPCLNPLFQRCIPETSLYRPALGMSFLFMILRWNSCVFEIWGSWEISQPPVSLCLFFFFPAPCLMHHASPHPMQRKPGVLTFHWISGKSPLLLYFKNRVSGG